MYPFPLYIEVTLAYFQSSGTTPDMNAMLFIRVNDDAMPLEASRSNLHSKSRTSMEL